MTRDLVRQLAVVIVVLLILAWLAPYLWDVYGLGQADLCTDWQGTNPTTSNVQLCPTPDFEPVP